MTAFDTAEKSPRYAELMAFTPDTSVAPYVLLLAFLATFTGVCAVMAPLFLLGGPMVLAPLSMAALGACLFFFVLSRMRRFQAAPLERVLVVVRDETVETRVETQTVSDREAFPHGHDTLRTTTSVRNDHYLLLELKNGDRQSHRVAPALARELVKDDVGVAYLKGGVLVDLKRLPAAA
jgi:hypothetical protein